MNIKTILHRCSILLCLVMESPAWRPILNCSLHRCPDPLRKLLPSGYPTRLNGGHFFSRPYSLFIISICLSPAALPLSHRTSNCSMAIPVDAAPVFLAFMCNWKGNNHSSRASFPKTDLPDGTAMRPLVLVRRLYRKGCERYAQRLRFCRVYAHRCPN
jgi:hypothetical protein